MRRTPPTRPPAPPEPPAPPRGNRPPPRRSRAALLILLAVLAGLAGWAFRSARRPNGSAPRNEPAVPATSASREQETIRAFVALEAAEAEAARTVLAPELRAQEWGARIEDFWEALQASSNALGRLAGAPVTALALPEAGPPEALPHGIRRTTPVAGASGGTPAAAAARPWSEIQSRVEGWAAEGWQLLQSEWRHQRYRPNPPASWFEVHLHATRPAPAARVQIRARVRFDWPDADQPGFGAATVEDFECLGRDGEPAFVARDVIEISPFPRTTWIDPLILRDTADGGGPEILLVGRNLAFRPGPGNAQAGSRQDALLSEGTPLTPNHPGLLFNAILADVTGDGRADLLCAVRGGLTLLAGRPEGEPGWSAPQPAWQAPERLHYAQALACGDVDGDGDLDVFLGQYRTPYEGGQMPRPYFDALDGPPAYLLKNDGAGRFREATIGSGLEPKRHRRSYGASFLDLDGDGDLDLWVTSDFAGADVWINDGTGRFTEATGSRLDDARGFGMSQSVSDFDADGRLDVLMLGMPQPTADRLGALGIERPGFEAWAKERARMTFGNRLFYGTEGGHRQRPSGLGLARGGWAWSAAVFDADADGFPDVHIANGHETRQSVRDYEREFWTHDIYVGDSTPSAAAEAYFSAKFTTSRAQGWSYGGHDRNRFHLNLGGDRFLEAGHLFGLALDADSRNTLAEDLDGDGDDDLLVTTFEIWPRVRQTLRVFENRLEPRGSWIGFRLGDAPGRLPPLGVEARLRTDRGRQARAVLAGDGYRSQSRPVIRFGLGAPAGVVDAEFRWPGGRTVRATGLAPGRIHPITAPSR